MGRAENAIRKVLLDAADIRGAYYEASSEGDNPSAGRQYYRTCQVDLAGEKGKIKELGGRKRGSR